MSTAASQKKDDDKGKSVFTWANVVSTVSLLIGLFNLFVSFNKEFPTFHFRWFQTPVGLIYSKVEVLPNEWRDVLDVASTSDDTLNNVVLSITNAINGSEVRYELGNMSPHAHKVLMLHETSVVTTPFPRHPYEMELRDAVFVTCEGYLMHEFTVSDLGKTALLKPAYMIPDLSDIPVSYADKNPGKELTCFVQVESIAPEGDWNVISGQEGIGSSANFTTYKVNVPKDLQASPGDTLTVQGVLTLLPSADNPFASEYRIMAKAAQRLPLPGAP